ncbi:MAG: hypothetical protein H5T41_11070 [Methanomassiliicoccales archaeon]|nr:hypothetical protein [Methanomassiliicoccales archaeon]
MEKVKKTLNEFVHAIEQDSPVSKVKGLSFRYNGKIIHNPPGPLIENLDQLPFPGYHFVTEHMISFQDECFSLPHGELIVGIIFGTLLTIIKICHAKKNRHWIQ